MREKFKYFIENDLLFIAFILLCVGIIAFFLGRASVIETNLTRIPPVAAVPRVVPLMQNPIPIVSPETVSGSVSIPDVAVETRPYVASKSGTKYHHVSCSGAKQIKTENKIFFATAADAEASGYSRATNCPSP